MLAGTLKTVEGTEVGTVSVRRTDGRWNGTVDLSSCPPALLELFQRFDECVNEQGFSFLDGIEEELARVGLFFVSHRGFAIVDEIHVFPGEGTVSVRLGISDAHRRFWTRDGGRFGRAVFEGVPVAQRPLWAAGVLRVFADPNTTPQPVIELIDLAERGPDTWPRSRELFGQIRELAVLEREAGTPGELAFLELAETVAKITYNASGATAPFDWHAGWSLAPRSRVLLDAVRDHDITDRCWAALTRFGSR